MTPTTNPLRMEQDEDARYRRALTRFDASWMSNAKWRKVLLAVAADPGNVNECEVGWIDSGHVSRAGMFGAGCVGEGHLHEWPVGGRVEYRWIHFLRFPRRCAPNSFGYRGEQDLAHLKAVILAAAEAMVVVDEDYLWIYGYSMRGS